MIGGWIQTKTGKKFYPLDPRIEDIDIIDIAWSLSNQCRYNGHSKRFYSVAEHSCYVSMYVDKEWALEGLLHDAAEAYISDVPAPIKPYLVGYKEIEIKLEEIIANKFCLAYPWDDNIKRIDCAILGDEQEQLMEHKLLWKQVVEPKLCINIMSYDPKSAYRIFMSRYNALKRGMI